jgi:hypothetical protein
MELSPEEVARRVLDDDPARPPGSAHVRRGPADGPREIAVPAAEHGVETGRA